MDTKKQIKEKYLFITLSVIVILIFLLFILVIRIINKNKVKSSYNTFNAYQVFDGKIMENEINITYQNNTISFVKGNEYSIIDNTPIYLDDTIILPKNTSIVFYNTNATYKVPKYTKVLIDDNIKLEYKTSKIVNNAFLFDGQSTFIFLENIDLVIDNNKYDLSPLSFVVTNQNSVEIFDYKDKLYKKIDNYQKCLTKLGNVSLDLKNKATVNNKDLNLLLTEIDKLDTLKED